MDKNKAAHHSKTASRRNFLAAAVGMPALAGAAALLTPQSGIKTDPPAASSPPSAPSDAKGYHETEHIRKYYSTAAF
ncbi:twin-arginine translocation signal domain-containing protein [Noviherbaspirillum sp.]|uniref:twin-arginine translocation signal domain-containing protein n=1 Tax=Noviherbaspirillum sp. TaxID=1926288 RepID=UPI002B49F590|nr:twin-arginine translocation signal domain-containing protein [Noviherbaspirillum sp.]HJV80940.1 twin-arginine translocation signal domain-containing protein [Noviherbaspirillum sp.]